KKLKARFYEYLIKNWRVIFLANSLLLIFILILSSKFFGFSYTLFLNLFLIILFSNFVYLLAIASKIVDKYGFTRRIHISKLKVGDVLLESEIWKGIDEKELKKVKKSRKYVWIKEGVRFAPVFPISLILTPYIKNLFFLLLLSFV
ncbi:MAG: hypothetical protein J7L39_04280, partial [Candidatus Aenigmarchaeota archaeon]|nr:hypothetical protein [Candidatus Aenigmarchaeota archaeon]